MCALDVHYHLKSEEVNRSEMANVGDDSSGKDSVGGTSNRPMMGMEGSKMDTIEFCLLRVCEKSCLGDQKNGGVVREEGGGDRGRAADGNCDEIIVAPEVDSREVGNNPGIGAVDPMTQIKNTNSDAGGGNQRHRV